MSKARKRQARKTTRKTTRKATARAAKRKSITGVNISPDERVGLYSLSRALPREFKEKSGLLLPFLTWVQDPTAGDGTGNPLAERVFVAWEPGIADGPTSSRFAVVDYDGDTDTLRPPARWDEDTQAFVGTGGKTLDAKATGEFQFHQVSVWALLQRALASFEDASALGRRVPWAFEGNRLIVVPHAGYAENAYYDRSSKSLQFYYLGDPKAPFYTCLSADIVHHEFGHAVLDGIRPLLHESITPQAGAFHEFFGDFTAILMALQNRALRQRLATKSKGEFADATTLSSLAEEFGRAVSGRPYLRSAVNRRKLGALTGEVSVHTLSEVLTGTMFDVLKRIGRRYLRDAEDEVTPIGAFWFAADRMLRMAIQPLDLLPPAEVSFRDYALAVCRSQQLLEPLDPNGYYEILIDAFVRREILSAQDAVALRAPRYLHDRLRLAVSPDIGDIARSRASAYRFLDDNREDLLIPAGRDLFVADLYDARKRSRQNLPLPRQIVLQYVWREEVVLDGERFGEFAGRVTTMLCGGTLVFDETGNVLSWMRKPGSQPYGGRRSRTGQVADDWAAAAAEGEARTRELLDYLAARIAARHVGPVVGSPAGLLGSLVRPMTVDDDGAVLRFRRTPNMHLSETTHLDDEAATGERRWQISC
jgi:hypothetical protein